MVCSWLPRTGFCGRVVNGHVEWMMCSWLLRAGFCSRVINRHVEWVMCSWLLRAGFCSRVIKRHVDWVMCSWLLRAGFYSRVINDSNNLNNMVCSSLPRTGFCGRVVNGHVEWVMCSWLLRAGFCSRVINRHVEWVMCSWLLRAGFCSRVIKRHVDWVMCSWLLRAGFYSRVINDSDVLVKYSTQSSVVNEPEDNGICRYWPAAGFCDRAMSEIVCQLSKFFKICLFAGEEESGRSSWQKGDECGGSRARHSCAHGLVTSQHCGLRPGEPGDLRRLNLTTKEARRAITSAAEVTTVEC